MELLLTLIAAYMTMTLIYSEECFIRGALIFILSGCAYALSSLLNNGYIFYFAAIAATALSLPFFRLTLTDLIKIALTSLIAAFWLSTAEFVDGFAYSEIFVALGITLSAQLLFAKPNRRICSVTIILISYGYALNNLTHFSALSLALALCIAWIFNERGAPSRALSDRKQIHLLA